MKRIREKIREFIDDPLGTAVEWFVYLILLGIAIAMLVWGARFGFEMVRNAFR